MVTDTEHLQEWVGNKAVVETVISVETANLMAATLDREPGFEAGDPLPPAWHWLYFHEGVKASDLGAEGHPKLGGFLPPVPLPRRMWAGGSLKFLIPLRIGDQAVKRSTVKSVTPKKGRSGRLCFVVVEHEITVAGQRCLSEAQTLVYREAAQPGQAAVQAQPAPAEPS